MTEAPLADLEDVRLLRKLARARGLAGRWEDGDFESAEDWCDDGMVIDQLAAMLNCEQEDLLEIYRAAHEEGLALREVII